LLSMTGFGRALAAAPGRQLAVEIRSVNHRNLDIKVRSRNLTAACEAEIHRAIRARLRRGSVQVTVDEESEGPGDTAGVTVRARELYAELESLRQELGIQQPVDLATVAAFLRLDRTGRDAPPPGWPVLEPAVLGALAELLGMRRNEGQALKRDLEGRVRTLEALGGKLRARVGPLAARAQARLGERLNQALGAQGVAVDPARLAQEAAVLADRLDVSEELARFETHQQTLAGWVSGEQAPPEGLGRALEFLLQELMRELNTLGAKSQDAEVSMLVVAGKAELEKIREQAQNIE